MPPSFGKRLWKSAEASTKRYNIVDRAISEESNEVTALIRIAALVPSTLEDTVKMAGRDLCAEVKMHSRACLLMSE